MLTRADGKRLGDLAAATLVVHQPRPAPKATLDMVTPVAPVRPLSPRDQSAVIALAARAPSLTLERLDELAALAASVQGEAREPQDRGDAPGARRRAMVVRAGAHDPAALRKPVPGRVGRARIAARA